jgi:SAM-dependent methyltransferase
VTPDASIGSPLLREHLAEFPLVRRGLFAAVSQFSGGLPPGSRILDAGAGNAPYAELFGHCDYVTADWGNSPHEHAAGSDIVASLDALPVSDASFDAVLCTEVLEHVRHPESVLAELARVLVPGGRLCLTVPFVWPLHEGPFDFFRYTPFALRDMLEAEGFQEVAVEPTSGFLSTLAQVADMSWWLYRRPAPLLTRLREKVLLRLIRMWSRPLVLLARRNTALDSSLLGVPLPIGFRVFAVKSDRAVANGKDQ